MGKVGRCMMKNKVLVVEDEDSIRKLVCAYLEKEGFQVFQADEGNAALKIFRAFKPDLIVLDIMLPGIDGLELLTQIRRESNVYVILLTARTEEMDKIIGLTMGADDYVTKPFSPRELTVRVKAAFRRMQSEKQPLENEILNFEHVRIDVGSRQVWVDESPIELTTIEFNLLRVLGEHRGLVLSREQLLEKVWGYQDYSDQRLVNVHMGNLRKKLGRDDLISTIRGSGYRFDDRMV
jgi:two-component system alkaline phosphatase synthesis response regulator PhoP